jgi:hypothetical protein
MNFSLAWSATFALGNQRTGNGRIGFTRLSFNFALLANSSSSENPTINISLTLDRNSFLTAAMGRNIWNRSTVSGSFNNAERQIGLAISGTFANLGEN